MKNSVSLSKKISTSSQICHSTDTFKLSMTETWSLRLRMVSESKCGTSINNPSPSDQERLTSHSISLAQEDPKTCKCGALILIGGNSSSMKTRTLSIGKTERSWMSQATRTMKVNKLLSTPDITELTKDGILSTSKTMVRMPLRVTTRTLECISTDHSTLYQDSHSEESWNALVLTMQ